jgi:transcription antitermination factor NusG
MEAYWAVARSEPAREAAAAHFLGLAGYQAYWPRLREQCLSRGRRIVVTPSLFPIYLFVRITLGWWDARWCAGVNGLIMNGSRPARLADAIIDEIKARETGGLVRLPEPALRFRPGDPVRITSGVLIGLSGLIEGMRGTDRVAILLGALRVTLPAAVVAAT